MDQTRKSRIRQHLARQSRLARIFQPRCTRERVLVLCWLTYTLAYLLRVNLAAVIPALMAERHFTYGQMGLVTGLFFMTYMFGQLLSGWLGDHYDSKLLIIGGLAVSALCNAGMILAPGAAGLALIWAVNGLAQSLLWAPIMKTLSVWFAIRQLGRVSLIMSMSMIVGYASSWGFSASVAAIHRWPAAFWVPAVLAAGYVLIMLATFRSQPEPGDPAFSEQLDLPVPPLAQSEPDNTDNKDNTDKSRQPAADLSMAAFFKLINLPGLMLIAMTQGIIREGISVWFPSIIESATTLSARSPWLILVIVPVVNLGGILLVRRVNQHFRGDSMRTLLLVFTLATTAAAILNLLLPHWIGAILAVMLVLLSLTYGLTPILTSVIPFQYSQFRRVSLTVGMLDFGIYVGAAVSAFGSGFIADRYSWSGVMVLWLAAAVVGLLLSLHRIIKYQGRIKHEQDIHNPS